MIRRARTPRAISNESRYPSGRKCQKCQMQIEESEIHRGRVRARQGETRRGEVKEAAATAATKEEAGHVGASWELRGAEGSEGMLEWNARRLGLVGFQGHTCPSPLSPCAPAPHRPHRAEPINFASNWRSRPTTIELIHGDLLPRRGLPIRPRPRESST